jgi:hypothetical protein
MEDAKRSKLLSQARRGSHSVAPKYVPTDRPITYAEIGVFRGCTTFLVVDKLQPGSTIHLFDFKDMLEAPESMPYQELAEHKGIELVYHKVERKYEYNSYNWPLAFLIRENEEPMLDYVFLDGAHMWFQDALAFFLCDRLLKSGGLFEFDDYAWKAAESPSVRGHPKWKLRYTPEQMKVPNVAMVVNLLVKRDPRYKQVEKNRIYKKG